MRVLAGTLAAASLVSCATTDSASGPVPETLGDGSSASSPASPTATAVGPGDVATEDPPVQDATVLDRADDAAAPVRVTVDELEIAVPVDPVGVAPDGQVEVPPDALRAGWYRFGPAPSEAGSSVIVAHAGSYITPFGPFSTLTDAEPGMRIDVELDDGTAASFTVTAVELLEKDGLDLGPYFVRSGPPHLILITCGGVWDDSAQSYLSNVLVTATLSGI